MNFVKIITRKKKTLLCTTYFGTTAANFSLIEGGRPRFPPWTAAATTLDEAIMPTGVGGVGALPMLATVMDVAAEQIDVIHLLLLLGALLTMVPQLPSGLIICVCWKERIQDREEWASCYLN